MPGVFRALFYHYPIYKSPYIQGAQWNQNLINNNNQSNYDDYDGVSLWIEEVQDSEVFDGLMLNFDNAWDISYVSNKWFIDG